MLEMAMGQTAVTFTGMKREASYRYRQRALDLEVLQLRSDKYCVAVTERIRDCCTLTTTRGVACKGLPLLGILFSSKWDKCMPVPTIVCT